MNPFLLLMLLFLQQEPVTGRVTTVDEPSKTVRVDLGSESGVEGGMGLILYSAPREVSIPGTGKTAYVAEHEVGTATIVEVLPTELVAQITRADEPIRPGARAKVADPIKAGPLPPHILKTYILDPAPAVWGRETAIHLNIEDLNNDLVRVECSVSAGLLVEPNSAEMRFLWMPPATAGEAQLTVRAIDAEGLESQETLTLKCSGMVREAKPVKFGVEGIFGSPFVRAADIACAANGNIYILDPELRRVAAWTPSGRLAWMSGPYGHDVEFIRMVVVGTDVLLLDQVERRVLRYELDRNMFSAGPVVEYGTGTSKPGRLRHPVDVAVTADENIWILDAAAGTIKTYAPDGGFQTSIGSFEDPVSLRTERRGTARVFDRSLRQILVFLGTLLIERISLPEGELPVDFIGTELLFPEQYNLLPLSEAVAIRRDPFGRTYILADGGTSLFRLDPKGAATGSRHAGQSNGATSVRTTPQGGFVVQGETECQVFDPDGWMLRSEPASDLTARREVDAAGRRYALGETLTCNDIPIDLSGLEIADFDVDSLGRVLILEARTGRVLRLAVTSLR